MSYCPVLIRLATAEHPEHTKVTYRSVWQEIGYGMMSIFKSDWDKAGGELHLTSTNINVFHPKMRTPGMACNASASVVQGLFQKLCCQFQIN